MTVSTTTSKVSYSGNGSTTAFAVSFYFLATSHLKVVLRAADGAETVKTLGTDYTVTGAGVSSGGTVTMVTAPASGVTVVIARNVPQTQLIDYQPNDPFPAKTHEQALDQLTMENQQQQIDIDRSIKFPITDISGLGTELPSSSARANKLVKFNSDGSIGVTTQNYDANIATLGAISSDISTVAGISSNVTSVAANSSNINTVAGINGNVTTVSNRAAEVAVVANDLAGTGYNFDMGSIAVAATGPASSPTGAIATVAANLATIQSVNGNSTNINAVSANLSNINTVATSAAAVNTVSSNISAVNSASTNMAAIIAAPTQAANAASSATAAANSATAAAASAASGLYRQVLDKTTNYTVVAADQGTLFRMSTGSGSLTVTLPQISTVTDGFKVSIVKWTGDGNTVTINRSGSDTINGATSSTIGAQYTQITYVADFETNQWFAAASGLGSTNVVVDVFSGNGSTTAFTLSGDPGTKNNTFVHISGVYQNKSTYSQSGTTLTFSSAPPAGTSNIEIVWTQPLAVGVPSDATITSAKLASILDLGVLP